MNSTSCIVCGTCTLLLVLMLAVPGYGQPAASCEDQLRQTQAQLSVTQAGRVQSEYIAADAIALLRKRLDELERNRVAAPPVTREQAPPTVPPPTP